MNVRRITMSVVTSIILTMHLAEDGWNPDYGATPNLDAVNSWLEDNGQLPLVFLTPYMPRGKHPQTLSFGGGYNHFPEMSFVHFLRDRVWENPENVVLVLQPEEGQTQIWRPGEDTRL